MVRCIPDAPGVFCTMLDINERIMCFHGYMSITRKRVRTDLRHGNPTLNSHTHPVLVGVSGSKYILSTLVVEVELSWIGGWDPKHGRVECPGSCWGPGVPLSDLSWSVVGRAARIVDSSVLPHTPRVPPTPVVRYFLQSTASHGCQPLEGLGCVSSSLNRGDRTAQRGRTASSDSSDMDG